MTSARCPLMRCDASPNDVPNVLEKDQNLADWFAASGQNPLCSHVGKLLLAKRGQNCNTYQDDAVDSTTAGNECRLIPGGIILKACCHNLSKIKDLKAQKKKC